MYKYSLTIKEDSDNAPFIIFNCADYSDNQQLLLAQLFGYVKGAFTGADKDKYGICT
uniref:Transcription antiterminator n=1 Tax=Clostridioides difficile TaxID=1496 RepID=A0A381I575_CLODI|nr:transcription antiterminator [Clostridioides difficile]